MGIARGIFSVKCNGCGKQHDISAEDADFELISSTEEPMGPDNLYSWEHEFICECGQEIEIIYEVSEYPTGTFNNEIITINGGVEISRFTFDFHGELEEE